MIGKQCVPYNYNGSKVTLITKIIQWGNKSWIMKL
jgi:hypothetical protein